MALHARYSAGPVDRRASEPLRTADRIIRSPVKAGGTGGTPGCGGENRAGSSCPARSGSPAGDVQAAMVAATPGGGSVTAPARNGPDADNRSNRSGRRIGEINGSHPDPIGGQARPWGRQARPPALFHVASPRADAHRARPARITAVAAWESMPEGAGGWRPSCPRLQAPEGKAAPASRPAGAPRRLPANRRAVVS
jgi:hypothetical protein